MFECLNDLGPEAQRLSIFFAVGCSSKVFLRWCCCRRVFGIVFCSLISWPKPGHPGSFGLQRLQVIRGVHLSLRSHGSEGSEIKPKQTGQGYAEAQGAQSLQSGHPEEKEEEGFQLRWHCGSCHQCFHQEMWSEDGGECGREGCSGRQCQFGICESHSTADRQGGEEDRSPTKQKAKETMTGSKAIWPTAGTALSTLASLGAGFTHASKSICGICLVKSFTWQIAPLFPEPFEVCWSLRVTLRLGLLLWRAPTSSHLPGEKAIEAVSICPTSSCAIPALCQLHYIICQCCQLPHSSFCLRIWNYMPQYWR